MAFEKPYTITRSWNRVVVENVAWEKRLEDERMRKLEEDEEIPEKRRVFNFGDTKESVDEQLYEYDLALNYKENKVHNG